MQGRQYAVLGPLSSAARNHAFLGCEVVNGQPEPTRPVVVVWLPEAVAQDQEELLYMQRQTAWVQSMEHPHVVRVHGLECFEEGWARIVDFVDGEPLRVVVDRVGRPGAGGAVGDRRMSGRFVVRIGLDAAAGLEYAHDQGRTSNGHPILHAGLRPDTLLVGFDGRTRVSGFGAAAFGPFRPATRGVDTRSYLAPEQHLGGRDSASVQTDVYALSAVLFELLTGKPPFSEAADIERAVLTEDLTAPHLPANEQRLMKVLRQGLHRRSQARFASMTELSMALVDAWAPDLPASHDELAEAMDAAFPPHDAARSARTAMLESARDPDVSSVLRGPYPSPTAVRPASSLREEPSSSTSGQSEVVRPDEASIRVATELEADAGSAPLAESEMGAAHGREDSTSGSLSPASCKDDRRDAVDEAIDLGSSGLKSPSRDPDSSELPSVDLPRTSSPVAPVQPKDIGPPVRSGDLGDAEALSGPVGLSQDQEIEPVSRVTQFNYRAGDGSKLTLIGAAVGAVVAGVLIMSNVPPAVKDYVDAPERKRLPRELVAEFLAEQPERPAPPPEATGPLRSVRIATSPGVDVYRGTASLGRTPLEVRLNAGVHELRFTDASLGINVYRRVTVPDTGDVSLAFEFQPAMLHVDAPYGADVFLNERPLGAMPIGPKPVYEGRYLLLVQHLGQSFRTTIEAEPGERIDAVASF
ncbi:MAG: serine/threonine protein kinase [Myxococcota bacterium]